MRVLRGRRTFCKHENDRLWSNHLCGTVRVTGRLLDRSKALECRKKTPACCPTQAGRTRNL